MALFHAVAGVRAGAARFDADLLHQFVAQTLDIDIFKVPNDARISSNVQQHAFNDTSDPGLLTQLTVQAVVFGRLLSAGRQGQNYR